MIVRPVGFQVEDGTAKCFPEGFSKRSKIRDRPVSVPMGSPVANGNMDMSDQLKRDLIGSILRTMT